ncbi:MAG: hypothetical protein RIC16_05965 [Rhodospirillales bacterium]
MNINPKTSKCSAWRAVIRRVSMVAATLTVSACYFDFRDWPDQLSNWQADPQACAMFWDAHFPNALDGDDFAAAHLYNAVAHRRLIPPGRHLETYQYSDQMKFDLWALERLALHEYRRPKGNAPSGPYSEVVGGFSLLSKTHPSDFNADMNDRALKVYEYLSGGSTYETGVCAQRTGLEHTTKTWAVACRQILAEDGVLPSSEEFSATIPVDARACGYEGALPAASS